jgi:hypothetical protein
LAAFAAFAALRALISPKARLYSFGNTLTNFARAVAQLSTTSRAQQAKAKAVVQEYGGDLTRAVVEAVIVVASGDLPTIDALHAARQRVFHAWQTRGRVPPLLPWTGTKRGASGGGKTNGDVRDRRKNFDEFDWGKDGGGHE